MLYYMRTTALLILLCLQLALAGFAQPSELTHTRNCATDKYSQVLQAQNPSFKQYQLQVQKAVQQKLSEQGQRQSPAPVITIPVVVHVVYNTQTENISDEQILSQLAVLNEDFRRLNADAVNTPLYFQEYAADTRIQFCLASLDPAGLPTTGITRTKTSRSEFYYFNDHIKQSAQGGKNVWPPDQYLNIWIGNIKESISNDNLLGYASSPGMAPAALDGVVLHYTAVGAAPANKFKSDYNRGRTATHEVGHWLGLSHIWGTEEASCDDSDGISDTPNQETYSFGCSSGIQRSCGNGPYGNMYQNYMDYSADACMNLFTKGQAAYMQAILHSTRRSIISSLACIGSVRAEFGTATESDTLVIAGKSIRFADASQGAKATTWYWEFEGGTPATSTQQNPEVMYSSPGLYDVKLTVSNGTLSSTEIKEDFVHVTVSDLTVYPNPTSGYLIIEQPARIRVRHVELLNSVGKTVVNAEVFNRTLQLDVRHLQQGIYYLRLVSTNGTEIRKINIIR
ncbi:M43 family zinc metalloprotease [Pontibacter rugosus]|uniref:M43 family zinc metalloprotease n=1 Tax=Pontibacter rugosus TaxID=1745966 RepID=A0ABW3SII6_9BACT